MFSLLSLTPRAFSSSAAARATLALTLQGARGNPAPSASVVVPLPTCGDVAFHLQPSDSVGDFVANITAMDGSLSAADVFVKSPSGAVLAGNTPWASVLRDSSVGAGAPLSLLVGDETHVLEPSYADAGGALGGELDLTALLKKEDFAAVAKSLRRDTRSAMSKDEFVALCANYEIDEIEAEALAKSLDGAGSILYFYDDPALCNTLFLKPKQVFRELHRALDIKTPHEVAAQHPRAELIASLEAELEPMKETHALIEKKAQASASRMMFLGFMGVVGQLAVISRLTWWEFSWDIMEPVSYVVMMTQAVGLALFYQVTNADPDSYDGLRDYFYKRKFSKLAGKHNFDVAAYKSALEAYDRLRLGSPTTRALEARRQTALDIADEILAHHSSDSHK